MAANCRVGEIRGAGLILWFALRNRKLPEIENRLAIPQPERR
jgi:hypothetical protein